MKKLLALIGIMGVVVTGCGPTLIKPAATTPTKGSSPLVAVPANLAQGSDVVNIIVSPDGVIAVDAAKVEVTRYRPGDRAETRLHFVNTGSEEAILAIERWNPGTRTPTTSLQSDGRTLLSYIWMPETVKWIDFNSGRVPIPAGSAVDVVVGMETPSSLKDLPDRWEYRVQVLDANQGMVRTATGIRFLVTMR
jgi:hypothetical protein